MEGISEVVDGRETECEERGEKERRIEYGSTR